MNIDYKTFYFSLITIAIIIVLGYILGKFRLISKEANKDLVNLLLTVFMPAALLNAFPAEYSTDSVAMFSQGFIGGFLTMLGMILVSHFIFNRKFFKGELNYEAKFAFIFNNATFLGYPLISTAFGPTGIIPYCGFIVAFNLALFSYGVWLFEHKISIKFIRDLIFNPNIIAVAIGAILFLARIELPTPVSSAVSYVAAATTPLSLICIGYMLSRAHLKTILKRWRLAIVAALQLILAPTITFLITSALHFPTEVILICTLIQALPTATSLGLFAEKYGGNQSESSELVVISTLLSAVTLPVIVFVFFG
jgi:hypothetical protein